MKALMKFLPVVLMAFFMMSCELFNVDVDKTLSAKLNIFVDDAAKKSTTGVTFSDSTQLDLSDYEEYADKIVEVEVGNVIARVDTVSKVGVVFYAGTVFSVWDDEDLVEWALDSDWPLEKDAVLTLDDLNGQYPDLEAILLRQGTVTVKAVGECSEGGVFVGIAIDMETTITGNILE